MENSGLKHGFEYTASSSPVARGPGAWSRGEGMLQHLYVASQVGSLDAHDRPRDALHHVDLRAPRTAKTAPRRALSARKKMLIFHWKNVSGSAQDERHAA